MLTRYLKRVVIRPSRSRSVTTNNAEKQNCPQPEDHSIIEWLSSPSTLPPPVTTRLTFSIKKSTPLLTTQQTQKCPPTHHKISNPQLKQYSSLLLSSHPLLRSPPSLPPLTIEYSSPNIAKPLHMGHLRSTLTGLYVRNVAEFAGHECRSMCFLGDWGRQFGVLHAGVLNELGDRDFKQYVDNLTLNQLLTIYVTSSARCGNDPEFASKALSLSAELESTFDNPSNGKHLWRHTRQLTVEHLKSCYESLGIHFDDFEGESSYSRDSDHTKSTLELLQSKNLSHRHEDGTLRVAGDHVLLKRDDSSVYLLRDISCALQRLRSHPSHRFVYVVDQGQSSHFKNLFEILRTLGVSEEPKDNLPFSCTHTHIPFGKVEGMSTRSGNFTLLSDIIDQGTTLMHEQRRSSKNARNLDDITVSQRLAISGLIVNALKVRRQKTSAFDWTEALRSNGNSGVALQYTIARLGSLLRRITGGEEIEAGDVQKHMDVLFEDGRNEIIEMIVCLMNFEDTFWKSYTQLEPCVLIAYSFILSDKVSKSLNVLNILNEPNPELANAALFLFHRSRKTLESCMHVLGIKPAGEF